MYLSVVTFVLDLKPSYSKVSCNGPRKELVLCGDSATKGGTKVAFAIRLLFFTTLTVSP